MRLTVVRPQEIQEETVGSSWQRTEEELEIRAALHRWGGQCSSAKGIPHHCCLSLQEGYGRGGDGRSLRNVLGMRAGPQPLRGENP